MSATHSWNADISSRTTVGKFPGLSVPFCSGLRFFGGAQFSRKSVRLYEYSYLGSVLIMNIHILSMRGTH